MPRYELITQSGFAAKGWKQYDSFEFAKSDATALLMMGEVYQACKSLPIAFDLSNNVINLVAIQSFELGQNLLVLNGKWVAPYVPAAYRGYPFALAQGEDEQFHLCVDIDSGLVGMGEGFDQPFFNEDGEATQLVLDVLNFLQQVHHNRAATQVVCAALAAEDLIVPWPLKVQTANGDRHIEGLYCIDEGRLKGLDAAALHRVHTAGALPIAYCQLLSMANVQMLGGIKSKLEDYRNLLPEMTDQIDVDAILKQQRSENNVAGLGLDNDPNIVSITTDTGDFDLSVFVKPK